jgi:alpha-tubulin suppressor-like RCC1 family protein
MVTKDGFLYSMGSNEDGKLGIGLSHKDLPGSASPRLVEGIKHVKSVSAGQSHSLAVVKDGKAYGWGQAEYGAIGMRIVNALQPVEIQFD